VIHGVLHLLGFDHIEDQQAELMEAKEIAVLKKLSINNPYQEVVNS
jgi:probable rRNA maturation factor